MRAPRLLLALPLAACGGGGSSSTTQPQPEVVGDLYDQWVAKNPGTYEPEELPGEVTCYGGLATMSGNRVAMNIRRAFDAEGGTYIEDSVAIFNAAGDPIRYVTTMPYGGDVGGPIEEVNGHYTGSALVMDSGIVQYVYELDNHGARYYTSESVEDGSLVIGTFGDTPEKMDAVGVRMPTDMDAWKGVLKAADVVVNDPENAGLGVELLASLPELSAERCREVFTHFPPAKRAW